MRDRNEKLQEFESSEAQDNPEAEESLIEEDIIVEDVSIDGMCGVY